MYWIYLILFILAVLVPDIVRGNFSFLSETRAEEFLIFFLGMAGFLIFVFKEHQLSIQQREKEKSQKRLTQTAKDLVDSYSYIGEVNRKMDILMQVGLGLSDRSAINKTKEKEIYHTILDATDSLVRAKCSYARMVDVQTGRTKKEVSAKGDCSQIKNADLIAMGDNINIKKNNGYLVAASFKEINGVKGYLIADHYSETEGNNQNNQEILKFLATQALFLYSYMAKEEK